MVCMIKHERALVRYGDLHWTIKVAVVMGWIVLVLWIAGFIYGYLTA